MPNLYPIRLTLLSTLTAIWGPSAAYAEANSKITAVTVYPGAAVVERSLQLPAGSTQAVFSCLPAGLDIRSLQVQGPASVRLGEMNVQTMERALDADCADALQPRVQAAEDALAQAQADVKALELVQTWLTTQAGSSESVSKTPPLAEQAQALRSSATDTWTQLHQAQRILQEREQALKRLRLQQGRVQSAQVVQVRVSLATASDAQLRLSYQVPGPSWGPSYRANLETASNHLQLERQAILAQTTGEDWRNVRLTLSTGRPLAPTQGALPRPWLLDIQPPQPPAGATAEMAMAAMPAPAPMARSKATDENPLPSFDPVSTQGSYTTEFALPQPVSVPSGGEKVTLTLGHEQLSVQLITRTAPAMGEHAWLVALLPTLEGDWPAGPVVLERDQSSVGQGRFDPHNSNFARLGLAFGRDERVQVHAAPVKELSGNAGLTGGRIERSLEQRFTVENRHSKAITVQVLDAAPVAQNKAIRVQSDYSPQPTSTAWGEQPGTVLWQQELAPRSQAAWQARHLISHDKGVVVRERH